jgi:hypothetical protein
MKTGLISPQFHVVFDDSFTTVSSQVQEDTIDPQDWERLLTFSRMLSIDTEEENPELDDEWLSDHELQDRRRKNQQYHRNQTTQGVTRQNQPELPEDADDVPGIQVDNDDSNDDDDQGDYWQPK